MSARPAPILADARTAAALFCMTARDFLALVKAGHLPTAILIGGHERWDVEALVRIARGDAARPDGGLEL